MSLHSRAASVLGWPLRDARSVSLQSLREMVRPLDPALADEIGHAIQSGSYVRGPVLADMSWLGEPPPIR